MWAGGAEINTELLFLSNTMSSRKLHTFWLKKKKKNVETIFIKQKKGLRRKNKEKQVLVPSSSLVLPAY